MQEFRDEAEMYSYQRIQLLYNKFINGILMVMLDLGTVISSNILVKVVDA